MKEKKNIDNIFKEGLKNFEATPSPRVWENIQAQLQKEKKERKVIPLWIRLGGVAALIALLISVGNWIYNPSDLGTPSIGTENIQKTEKNQQENNSEIVKEANETQVASEEKTIQNDAVQNSEISEANSSKIKGETESTNKSSNKALINSSEKEGRTIIASNNSEKKNSKEKTNPKNDFLEKNISKSDLNEDIAISKNHSENTNKTTKNANENIIKTDKDIFDTNNQSKEGIVAIEKPIKDTAEKNSEKTETEVAKDSQNKKSIFDAIAQENEDVIVEKTKKQKPEHRWIVAPNVAPVYYSSLGNGSSIDPSFADNSQKGDVNMSYGVQVSYALSNRLSVRTGLNNV